MKTIIAGSRTIRDYATVKAAIESCPWWQEITEVVSGAARGVDVLGEQWATDKRLKLARFPADWDKYGKAAGPMRNNEMSIYADALIAIRIGGATSRGTTHMIDSARRRGLKVYVVEL